jgi:CHAT domain-containing protein/tetratricopeptide (TPR) repeat protein
MTLMAFPGRWCGCLALLGFLLTPARSANPDSDPERLDAAFQKANSLRTQGKLAEATREMEKAATLADKVFGPRHLHTANILHHLASLHQAQGQHVRAEPLLQRSLQIKEAELGKDHIELSSLLNDLAAAYRFQKKYHRAEALLKRGLLLGEKHRGKDHLDVGSVLNNLAQLSGDQGRYNEAEAYYQRSLHIFETQLGKDHLAVATILTNQADMLRAQSAYRRAEPLLQRCLRIRETHQGKDHLEVAGTLRRLAESYAEQGLCLQAEAPYERCLAIYQTRLGKDHPLVASLLLDLARVYKAQARYARAEEVLRRSLRILETRSGKYSLDVAAVLGKLAVLFNDQGLYAKAEEYYLQSLRIKEARLGPNHPRVAPEMNNLGTLYTEMGQYARAETHLRRCLRIERATGANDDLQVALTLNNLAQLYTKQKKYARAEDFYRQCLQIQEAKLNKDHPALANSFHNLAVLDFYKGKHSRAAKLFGRSLKIWEAALGPEHPEVANCLHHLGVVYAFGADWDRATRMMDRSRRLLHHHLRHVLPALSEPEQLNFLGRRSAPNYHAALSLALRRRTAPGIPARSAAWVLNAKASALIALTDNLLLARASNDRRQQERLRRLLAVREELANQTFAGPRRGQEARHREHLVALSQREEQLAKQLAQDDLLPSPDRDWIDVEAVRKALDSRTVLIEIARFPVFDFQARGDRPSGQAPRYAAWVIPARGRGDVQLIDLGEAEKIESAVLALRQALGTAPRDLRSRPEAVAEKGIGTLLKGLARLVLAPLTGHIDQAKCWVISPDAALWLVPWAALPLADGSYAVEKHQITYLVSGRDVISPPIPHAARAAVGPPLVLADPDFDLAPAKKNREGRVAARGLLSADALPPFPRLPATAAEARAVAPLLKRYARSNPVIRTGREAQESSFKAARSPKVVVLSTHGFFLPDQEDARPPALAVLNGRGLTLVESDQRPARGSRGQVLENPLLRCGLALAGANRRGEASKDGDDGILTGLEVVGCDLRGTELVVLSACETGLGQVRVGEGVAGLRQAFQLAGARAVVATLWQISDQETTALMTAFFKNLAAKKEKAEALRRAQLEIIKERRAKGKAAHPFYWAAFTLTGR